MEPLLIFVVTPFLLKRRVGGVGQRQKLTSLRTRYQRGNLPRLTSIPGKKKT